MCGKEAGLRGREPLCSFHDRIVEQTLLCKLEKGVLLYVSQNMESVESSLTLRCFIRHTASAGAGTGEPTL